MSSLPPEMSGVLSLSHNLADVVEQAGRSVVTVNARQRIPSTGVHWRSGLVVTANHTVKRDEEIAVTLPDGPTLPVTLVGRDSGTDLAVLKLQDVETTFASLPIAEVGDTASLKVGHIVLAIGRPGKYGLSASFGIVGATGGAWHSWCGGQIDQFVRLDLTLYPGFSGGPLVDVSGRIVGINTAGPRTTVLAIPTSTVNRVVDQLLDKGHIARGYLGLSMQPVRLPDTLKSTLNLPRNGGVIVVNIEPKGPADQAGVLIGDVILSLDATAINDTDDVLAILGSESVGKTINAQIVRGGTLAEVAIAVGERPYGEE